jgi:hypothetical protein
MKDSLGSAWWVGGVPLAVGGMMLTYAVRTGRRAWQSRVWPRVTGTVLESGVVEVATGRRPYMQYRPVVVYSYEVAGATYRGDQLGFGFNDFWGDGLFGQRADAEKFATAYRPGTAVPVAYDPENNSKAVLKTGINQGHVVTLLSGLFFIGLGVCCLWNLWLK